MQTPTDQTVIERPGDLTAEWLTSVLRAGTVTAFDCERIGTGQMSECYRVVLSYAPGAAGPDSVVLKVAADDPTSRQTGLMFGVYEREVRFYTEIAPRLADGSIGPVAPCYHAGFQPETGVFDLVLGDAAPAVVGDEIRGATVEQAMSAVSQLGRLHAPLLGDSPPADAEWLNAPMTGPLISGLYAGFVDRYGDTMTAEQHNICERFVASFDQYVAEETAGDRPMGLVHGDYRLDNMLFGQPGADRPVTVVDWQTVSWGPALTDLAYFVGGALPTPERREFHDALLRAYHDALGPDPALSLDEVREGVRRRSFYGVMMTIASSMLVVRTERGDEMFLAMLDRHCSHILDTDALAVLPEPAAGPADKPVPPGAGDEAAHTPGKEPLWNESWYADFVDPGQQVGGWVRLGLIPNHDTAWLQALFCGPGLPTIAVSDFEAPLPSDPWRLVTEDFEFTHAAPAPLCEYAMTVRGRGQAYEDPSTLLRGGSGRPVDVTMDLKWSTDGTPYQYPVTARYEIPCTVSGTVSVDGHNYVFDGVPGQRDHSWGVRDWWSMEWVWSALHLNDGTHLHGVDVRVPGLGPMGIGYLQNDGAVTELAAVTAKESFSENGLPLSTELRLQPGDVVVDARVVGHAPVRLVSWDGRISEFPRAWATVTTADGRHGVGWLEWNRNR